MESEYFRITQNLPSWFDVIERFLDLSFLHIISVDKTRITKTRIEYYYISKKDNIKKSVFEFNYIYLCFSKSFVVYRTLLLDNHEKIQKESVSIKVNKYSCYNDHNNILHLRGVETDVFSFVPKILIIG